MRELAVDLSREAAADSVREAANEAADLVREAANLAANLVREAVNLVKEYQLVHSGLLEFSLTF